MARNESTFNAISVEQLTAEEATVLAREPHRGRLVARELQRLIDASVRQHGFIVRHEPGTELSGRDAKILAFHNEQERLRQEFVDSEVTRRFGTQGVTSGTTVVNAAGERVPVAGRGTQATRAQRDEIGSSFMTPLQLLISGKSQTAFAKGLPAPSVSGPKPPTIISGAGIQRRRARGAPAQTILTSDADALSGETLLG